MITSKISIILIKSLTTHIYKINSQNFHMAQVCKHQVTEQVNEFNLQIARILLESHSNQKAIYSNLHTFLPSGFVYQWPADWPFAWTRRWPASFGVLAELLGFTQLSGACKTSSAFDFLDLFLPFVDLFATLLFRAAFCLEASPLLNEEMVLGSIQPPEGSKTSLAFDIFDLFLPLVELFSTLLLQVVCCLEASSWQNCLLKWQ